MKLVSVVRSLAWTSVLGFGLGLASPAMAGTHDGNPNIVEEGQSGWNAAQLANWRVLWQAWLNGDATWAQVVHRWNNL